MPGTPRVLETLLFTTKTQNNMPDFEQNQEAPIAPLPIDDVQSRKSKSGADLFPNERHWQNVRGFLRTTTSTPTKKPKSINEAVVIYANSLSAPTVLRLYLFSPELNAWHYVNLT